MQHWKIFARYRGSWIEFSFRSAYLVFNLWVKILRNIGGFKFCFHFHIKHRTLQIFNWKTSKVFISFKRGLVYTDLCDKLHEQHIFGNNKDVQVYFYWCLTRQYLHCLHNYEEMKNIVALDIVCLIHLFIENAYAFINFTANDIDVLFPGQIFSNEYT